MAGGRASEQGSGWGNLYLKVPPRYRPGRPGTRSWGEGPAPRCLSAPAPNSRNRRGLALLPAGSAAAFRARPHAPSRSPPPAGRAAAQLPRVSPRPGTTPHAPEVPDWEGAAGWGRSAQAPEPGAKSGALPGGGAERKAVRMRATFLAPVEVRIRGQLRV